MVMIKNNRAWLRIVEVVIAIILLLGVVLTMYTQRIEKVPVSELVSNVQIKILDEIALNDTLRGNVLNNQFDELNSFVRQRLVDNGANRFDFSINVCNINGVCGLAQELVQNTIDKEVFIEEKIISGNLEIYTPKKVRLFLWER